MNQIIIKGARVHNLKNITLTLPKFKLIAFTGISGSGKSSLAFDTIFAEGQRRYVESLSSYARQFLGVMEKPDVDTIEGLSPSISIDQKAITKNPRSTVGTTTEIYDYLRLLFARIGHPHCPICNREVSIQTFDQIIDGVLNQIVKDLGTKKITRFLILSRIIIDKKGEFVHLFKNLKAKGVSYLRIDGQLHSLSKEILLIKTNRHTIDAVIDRISVNSRTLRNSASNKTLYDRLRQAVQLALLLSNGSLTLSFIRDRGFEIPDNPKLLEDFYFSEKYACPYHNIQIEPLQPKNFSFNSPQGACQKCLGLGVTFEIDENLTFSKELSISQGGILPFSTIFENETWYSRIILKVCEENNINIHLPIKDLSMSKINLILEGTNDRVYKVRGNNRHGVETIIYEKFLGITKELKRRFTETGSDWVRSEIKKYMYEERCDLCLGNRLKKEIMSVTVDNKNIGEVANLTVSDLLKWINNLRKNESLSLKEKEISSQILIELEKRVGFLYSLGLSYITVSRNSSTLSGGEAQRIRLASQIGTGLSGVLYILDEPTIGLHPKDTQKLIENLKKLQLLGNTIIVVEHDPQVIANTDYIVDFGPGAGKNGGKIVYSGETKNIIACKGSLTGKYLSGKKNIILSRNRLEPTEFLTISGCQKNNLKNIQVDIPLNRLIAITGVSGSGKSSLLVDTIYPVLKSFLGNKLFYDKEFQKFKRVTGYETIKRVVLVDQSPIGRTPRSNPATYTKAFDEVRDIFASTRESRLMGYQKGAFSFNVKGGRCEACEGQGVIKIEMQFLNDIWTKCEACEGKRYSKKILEIEFKDKNIFDILHMTVSEGQDFFSNFPKIIKKLDALSSVGLSYLELGQPSTTLSGGEAQRIKLASELTINDQGGNFYILDEPTTGLHPYDIEKLLQVLKLLVEKNNTVVVVEHNLDVIKNCDWIIDLGPDGGNEGGNLVYEGPLEKLKSCTTSYTGQFLKNLNV